MEIIPAQVQIGSFLVSIIFLISVLGLVRNNWLRMNYALMWLFSALIALVLAMFPIVLKIITDIVGVKTPSNLLFAVAIMLLSFIVLALSVNISRMSEQNRTLMQELSIQHNEIEKMK